MGNRLERQVTVKEKPDDRETEASQDPINSKEKLELPLRSRISGAKRMEKKIEYSDTFNQKYRAERRM